MGPQEVVLSMLPLKAIQSEERAARFISLIAILRLMKLFSCTHVTDKDVDFLT